VHLISSHPSTLRVLQKASSFYPLPYQVLSSILKTSHSIFSSNPNMQYSIAATILLALGCNIVTCAPHFKLTTRQSFQDTQTLAAAENWQTDTGTVSQFLSTAESLDPSDLVSQASTALSAELDELTRKSFLDLQFLQGNNPNTAVQAASTILVAQGTFQFVVNGLQGLADNGANMTPDDVTAAIQSINADRCGSVLPAIDQYFLAVGQLLGTDPLTAIRPTNCP
jgi:hypothetical protein